MFSDIDEQNIIIEENEIHFKNISIKEKNVKPKSKSSFSSINAKESIKGTFNLVENKLSSFPDKEKDKQNSEKNSIFDQKIEDQIKLIQKDPKKHKKVNIYIRNENFDSAGTASLDNTDSNEENSINSLNHNKKISSNNNSIKTENVKNETLSSLKERYFWTQEKFERIKENIKIAKFRVIQKENNDFDKIFELIDCNRTEELM